MKHARMHRFAWVWVLLIGFVSGGATCAPRTPRVQYPPPPPVLNPTPSLQEVTSAVNRTRSISQLSTNSASVEVLSEPKLPRLTNANIHMQRDRFFRLRANVPLLLGAGVDLGSNDQMFWFEVPEGIGKTLYFANHNEYQRQLHRTVLPVDPTWLMDALGLLQIDPASVVAGPVVRSDGLLEIRSTMNLPDGTYQRVCMIEPRAGYITDQLLYGPDGSLIAQSHAAGHAFYDQVQCPIPHQVELTISPKQGPPLSLRIEVGNYVVNQLLSNEPNLFVVPATSSKQVDLSKLRAGQPPAIQASLPIEYRTEVPKPYPIRGLH